MVAVPIGHSFDHFDLVVDALDHAIVCRRHRQCEDPIQSLLERLGELDERRDAAVDRPPVPLLPEA